MPVLKYLQLKSKFSWSLSTLAALLRQQPFFYHDLWVWLDDPFQGPPALAGLHDNAQQLPGKDVPDTYWLDEGVGFCISAFAAPDGRVGVSGSTGGWITVWEMGSGKKLRNIKSHDTDLWAVYSNWVRLQPSPG
jgi:hypothetical protein